MMITDWKWYTSRTAVGFVLLQDSTTEMYVCYTGAAAGNNEQYDIEQIKEYGAYVEQEVAEAMFRKEFPNYKRS